MQLYILCHLLNISPESPTFYLLFFGVLFAFYGANWEEGHTHILRCTYTIGGVTFGLTESQWLLISTMCVNGLTNNRFAQITLGEISPSINDTVQSILKTLNLISYFDQKHLIMVEDFRFCTLFIALSSILGWFGFLTCLVNISKICRFQTAIEGILPLIIFTNFYCVALYFSNIALQEPIWVIMIASAFFCLSTTKIIICNLVKVDFSIFDDFHLCLPILISTFAYPLNWMYWRQDEKMLTQILLVMNLSMYFWYVVCCINQITKELGIHCLTIKK